KAPLKSCGMWVDFPNGLHYPLACSKTNLFAAGTTKHVYRIKYLLMHTPQHFKERCTQQTTIEARLGHVSHCLTGLSIGDGLGRLLFTVPDLCLHRQLPDCMWPYTDGYPYGLGYCRQSGSPSHGPPR